MARLPDEYRVGFRCLTCDKRGEAVVPMTWETQGATVTATPGTLQIVKPDCAREDCALRLDDREEGDEA